MRRELLSLPELRMRLGVRQHEIGGLLGISQPRVSRIEHDLATGRLRVGALDQYVQAMGGRLLIIVTHQKGRFHLR